MPQLAPLMWMISGFYMMLFFLLMLMIFSDLKMVLNEMNNIMISKSILWLW